MEGQLHTENQTVPITEWKGQIPVIKSWKGSFNQQELEGHAGMDSPI